MYPPPVKGGAGLSRLAAETLLLVLGLILALLVFGPIGSYASSALFGTTSISAPSTLGIYGAYFAQSSCTSGTCMEVSVKNDGPMELRNASRRGAWILIVDDYYCGEPDYVDVGGDDVLGVGEVATLRWSDNQCTRYAGRYTSIYATSKEHHMLKLYGPQGTFAVYSYYPG
ncbi:MAG: hypothetical protein QI223_05260 [Candidatus Korarchaeota archaeon]|nr:hypothetical protein [Candidatus Korarchaeota archaeon]